MVDVADATIDEIITTGIDNCEPNLQNQSLPHNRSRPSYEANNFVDELLDKTLMGKISTTLGKLDIDEVPGGCPLFTTTLDDLEEDFQS